MSALGNLIAELRRRRVFRAAAIYVVGAWVAIQVAGEALPALDIPDTAIRYVWLLALVGFPIAVILAWRYDFAAGGLVRTRPAAADESVDLSLKRSDYVVLLALLVVSSFTVWKAVEGLSDVQQESIDRPVAVAEAPENSIVVLPLRTASDDDNYISYGLTEELSHSLTRLPQLRVTANRSAFAVAKLDLGIRDIGERLGVRYILDGSVRRHQDRVRVNIELLDSATAERLWDSEFDEEMSDILTLQSEIAGSVLVALQAPLDETVRGVTAAAGHTASTAAYDQYLLGLDEIRNALDRERIGDWVDRAIAHFENAVEADPEFADAHAMLARAHVYMLWSIRADQLERSTEIAMRHIERALELDPDSETAYLALARIRDTNFDQDGFVAALEKVLEINPANQEALDQLGREYWIRNEIGKARDLIRATYLRDPLNPAVIVLNADLNSRLGNYDRAKKLLLGLIDEQPDFDAADALIMLEIAYGQLAEAAHWASLQQRRQGGPLAAARMAQAALFLQAYEYAEQWLGIIEPEWRSLTMGTELVFLLTVGRHAEAEALVDGLAAQLVPEDGAMQRPMQARILSAAARVHAVAGNYERSLAYWRRVDPRFERRMDVDERVDTLIIMMTAANGNSDDEAFAAYSELTDRLLRSMETAGPSVSPRVLVARAEWHAARGDADAALASLSQAVDLGFRIAARIRLLPPWNGLREQPRFAELVARMDREVEAERRLAMENGWLFLPESD